MKKFNTEFEEEEKEEEEEEEEEEGKEEEEEEEEGVWKDDDDDDDDDVDGFCTNLEIVMPISLIFIGVNALNSFTVNFSIISEHWK